MTPKHEDNNFIRGLIIGGLLAAIAVGVGFLVNLYNDSGIEQAIELKNRVVDEEERIKTVDDSQNLEENLQKTTINDDVYYIVDSFKSEDDEYVFRLLSLNNELSACYSPSELVFSIWSNEGNELISYSKVTELDWRSENFISSNTCVKAKKWIGNKVAVIFEDIAYHSASDRLFFYTIEEGLEIGASYYLSSGTITSQHIWSYNDYNFIQEVNHSMETVSPVYNDLDFEKVNYVTDKLFKADITSDYNLRNYEKGLKGEINGEEVILLWDQN